MFNHTRMWRVKRPHSYMRGYHGLTLFTIARDLNRGEDTLGTERAGISRQTEALLWLDLLLPCSILQSLKSSMHTLQVINYWGK